MNDFKEGDKVGQLDGSSFSDGSKILTVDRVDNSFIWLKETGTWSLRKDLVKVYDNPKHVHHDLIIEWARGAEVEYLSQMGNWLTIGAPSWYHQTTYRIKPTNPNAEKLKELEGKARELADEIAKLKE